MWKTLPACPVCGGQLIISGLTCGNCETAISGKFELCDFCRLTDEQSTFLRLFVERRGNLSELEKALGISYPTVRNKLEEIIRALQPPTPSPLRSSVGGRSEILQQVSDGQLSAEAALDLLASMNEETN